MNNNCSATHFPDTSERIFYKPIKVGTTRQKGTRLLQLSGSWLALRRDFWCVWGGWYQSSTVTCVWTSSLSVFAPSFTLAPIPQGLGAFPLRWRLIRGQLVRDTRAIVLTLTVGHWNANREHSKPNGVEEQQIFGQDFFFSFADGAGLFMVDETRLEQMAIRCAEPSFELSANQIKAGSDTCGKKKGRAEADCSISSH